MPPAVEALSEFATSSEIQWLVQRGIEANRGVAGAAKGQRPGECRAMIIRGLLTIWGVINDELPKRNVMPRTTMNLSLSIIFAQIARSSEQGVLHPTRPRGLRHGGAGPSREGRFPLRDFSRGSPPYQSSQGTARSLGSALPRACHDSFVPADRRSRVGEAPKPASIPAAMQVR